MKRGADVLAAAMAEAGVTRVFSLSGNQIMPVYDACIDAGIEIVHVRHEAAAVHMADAWARTSGTLGVALVTAGPGHANSISALFDAKMSEAPVVAMSGHAPLDRIGQGAFQEMPQAEMAATVCKAAWTADSAAGLGGLFAAAATLACQGRPGPVHISLPFDVVQDRVKRAAPAWATRPLPRPDAKDVDRLARWLSKGKRPLILGGAVFTHAPHVARVRELDGAGGVPALALESPRGINDPALGAFAQVLARADRILLLGREPDYCIRFGEAPVIDADCRFAHVEVERPRMKRVRRQLGKRLRRVVQGDPLVVAGMLAPALAKKKRKTDSPWCDEVRDAINYRPAAWDDIEFDESKGLHPLQVCSAVQGFLERREDPILILDGGEFGQWAQSCLSARRRIINGLGGAIGASLSYAGGAKLADPASTVLVMLGDGTVGFHLSEFDTAVRAGTPFVAIIGNDACWNAEHQIQLRDYGPQRLIGCELRPTRYDQVVAAMGGHGEYVERAEDMGAALERAAASGLPACINVKLDGQAAPVVRMEG